MASAFTSVNDQVLLRLLGVAAILGGLLRIGSAFIPWAPNVAWLEAFYLVIDVLLLFGLMGFYFAHRARLGAFGFVAFVIAESGIAAIVGPDATAFGIDTYATGVLVITIGLTLLSLAILATRGAPWWVAACWLGSAIVGVGGSALGQAELGFFAGGILFGLGFIAAGVATMNAATPQSGT